MKALAISIILFLAVSSSNCQEEEEKIGECLVKDYAKSVFPCHTNFIHSLQKNNQSDCRAEMEAYFNCGAKGLKQCFPSMKEADAKAYFQKQLTKEILCDKAGLQSPVPEGVALNQTICKTTWQDYIAKANACADKILKMWKANRADKGLCREYINVKRCQIDIVKSDLSCLEKKSQNLLDQLFGEYGNVNPFCEKGVDPSSAVMTGSSYSLLICMLFAAFMNFFKF